MLLVLLLAPAAAFLAGRPTWMQTDVTTRRALIATAAATVFAASVPASHAAMDYSSVNMPTMLCADGQASQTATDKSAAETAKAAEKAAKQAEFKRVRAQRMAAEARAQSEEYAKVMAGVGTQSFGSTTTVR